MSDLINRDAFITYLKTARASAYLNELADCDTEEAKWRIDDEMYYSTKSFIDVLKYRPTVDAVPVAHLADLLERWNWACAVCTHSVDCDKCGLNRCINELKEIIDSSTREKSDSDAND